MASTRRLRHRPMTAPEASAQRLVGFKVHVPPSVRSNTYGSAVGHSPNGSESNNSLLPYALHPHRFLPRGVTVSPLDAWRKNIEGTRQHREELLASPFGLIEELFVNDPWRLLLSTIMLNRTTRAQVDPVLHDFLELWPRSKDAAVADVGAVGDVVAPLGIHRKRAAAIVRFSGEYLALLDSDDGGYGGGGPEKCEMRSEERAFRLLDEEILGLYWCGPYALCAYQIFIKRQLDVPVMDHALHMYVDYMNGCSNDSFV